MTSTLEYQKVYKTCEYFFFSKLLLILHVTLLDVDMIFVTVFKIEQKLYMASGSIPPKKKKILGTSMTVTLNRGDDLEWGGGCGSIQDVVSAVQ